MIVVMDLALHLDSYGRFLMGLVWLIIISYLSRKGESRRSIASHSPSLTVNCHQPRG